MALKTGALIIAADNKKREKPIYMCEALWIRPWFFQPFLLSFRWERLFRNMRRQVWYNPPAFFCRRSKDTRASAIYIMRF